jgi:hypothetical protein
MPRAYPQKKNFWSRDIGLFVARNSPNYFFPSRDIGPFLERSKLHLSLRAVQAHVPHSRIGSNPRKDGNGSGSDRVKSPCT